MGVYSKIAAVRDRVSRATVRPRRRRGHPPGSNVSHGGRAMESKQSGTFDVQAFLDSAGGAGFMDPRGHLVIIDRAKDVGALSEGTPFAPQFIENKLKFSPYIREAVAFGNDRPFVAAMIAIDLTTVGTWAERRGLAYTSYADLSQKLEIRGLVRDEIAKGNLTLPDATRVRRFLLLTKDLEADDAEMTRTRKVRRRYVAEKYAPVIDAFYSGRNEVELQTAITYEDGRQANIQSQVHLEDVDTEAAARV